MWRCSVEVLRRVEVDLATSRERAEARRRWRARRWLARRQLTYHRKGRRLQPLRTAHRNDGSHRNEDRIESLAIAHGDIARRGRGWPLAIAHGNIARGWHGLPRAEAPLHEGTEQSEAIICNHMQSYALRGNQGQSGAIRGNQCTCTKEPSRSRCSNAAPPSCPTILNETVSAPPSCPQHTLNDACASYGTKEPPAAIAACCAACTEAACCGFSCGCCGSSCW